MKVGDRLYTIYEDDWPNRKTTLSVETAEILSVGPKRITIGGTDGARPGLAFHCSSHLTIERANQYGHSEKEAWLKYYEHLNRQIGQQERELVRLRSLQQLAAERVRR